jgi:3-isopropylmalate/(R)-2-methylmalate dehydratase small subunit
MSLEKITTVTGTALAVPGNDIDTDRIIPARFMKCVTFDGLGEFAFYDERDFARKDGRTHPFDEPERASASILVSGVNFGCGSSREHAPQSLYHWGIRGIVAGSFAEIFFGNSTTLGIPCMTASEEVRGELAELVQANPALEVTLDVQNLEIRAGDRTFAASLPASAQQALTEGRWDPIAELLQSADATRTVDQSLSYAS